jgi:hypothetical protein
MHAYLAGNLLGAGEVIAFQIHDDHIGRLEEIFAATSGGSQDAVRAEASGEIPRATRREAESIEPLAELNQTASEFIFGFLPVRDQRATPVAVHSSTFRVRWGKHLWCLLHLIT